MQSKADDFSLKNYEYTLSLAKEKGYIFKRFKDIDFYKEEKEKSILMRHDVDSQLDIAVKMAFIENKLNIMSTYFIRMHSHSYNPLCIKDTKKIQKIASLGHEIGFHYEPDYYSLLNIDFESTIKNEIQILGSITSTKIISFAPHEPTRTGIKSLDINLDLKKEAYDELLFKKFKYISDSSCRWREGSMRSHIKNETYKNIYILTHPQWWYANSPIENY